MNDHYPLCSEPCRDRTNLRIHLEVEHRTSEVVSYVIDAPDDANEPVVETETGPIDEEQAAPPI